MTQNNQTSTSKQNQDKEQHARELHDKIEQEQKQNEIDKQHKQKHEEVLEAQKNGADEKSDNQQDSKASGNQQSEQKDASKNDQSDFDNVDQSDKKTESTKMDDLKAKAIAIGEELLQKGEKILNELKNGKSDSQKNGEQGSDDSKKAQDHTSGDKSANQTDQDRMANLKDEALHKFEDTKVKISDLVNEAATKLNELKQMAAETMTKMQSDEQSQ